MSVTTVSHPTFNVMVPVEPRTVMAAIGIVRNRVRHLKTTDTGGVTGTVVGLPDGGVMAQTDWRSLFLGLPDWTEGAYRLGEYYDDRMLGPVAAGLYAQGGVHALEAQWVQLTLEDTEWSDDE